MISENNEEAYSMMLEKYQPLIGKYADYYIGKYDNRGIEKEELIQEGTIGLIKAINSFNYDKGIRFATYAVRCIQNEILMCLRSEKTKKEFLK